ncbi:MAG: SRPBCC family protein [Candidatus Hydrogenedentes bacterium]|nr:SRPBCC family protein [Candidatus Hydrogenedentota bacterium]
MTRPLPQCPFNRSTQRGENPENFIFIAIAVLAALFFAVVAMQPSDFRVTRSAMVSAPPQAVFDQVNDFHKWEAWNPWGKIDPAMTQTHEGPPAGVGASYYWLGNNEVGEGRMTITDSNPPDLVRIKLEFLKPFAATNTAEFTFKPEGDQTNVTWTMYGKNSFMSKNIGLFMNMDTMIGGMFEKGLAEIKTIVESPQ